MRIPLVAGNWKMHKTIAETRQLILEMVYGLDSIDGVQKVICPPYTALLAASALLEGTNIELGAQNMHWEKMGAFTGEISPLMVAELCRYVIIGHSERRTYFGENDLTVNKKVKAALEIGLETLFCIGETIEQRDSDQTVDVISTQVRDGLMGIQPEQVASLVICYEPVWAIGTGRAATPEDANDVIHQIIRPILIELFGDQAEQGICTLYGGSVNGANASEFFKKPDIDGALVGGASLKAQDFIEIAKAALIRT